jgi:hypothetical protein
MYEFKKSRDSGAVFSLGEKWTRRISSNCYETADEGKQNTKGRAGFSLKQEGLSLAR